MRKFTENYIRFCDFVERILNYLLFLSVSALIIVVFLQVITRYITEKPWLWTMDFGILFLIWSTLIATGLGVRHNSHFEINLWPQGWKRLSKVLNWVSVLSMIFLGYFLFTEGLQYTFESLDRIAGMTRVSMGYFLSSIPFSAVLIILFAAEKALVETFEKKEDFS